MNGLPAMKNPDALRIFFPEYFGGKYKSLKKHNSRRIISSIPYVDKVKRVKNTGVSQPR
jgi:hypothetical protein